MTKNGAWRMGSLGWCKHSYDCKWWQTSTCDKCFKCDRYEKDGDDDENDD